MRIALGQIECVSSDLEGNLDRIFKVVALARTGKAEAVFFPEASDFGWVNPEAHRLASPIPGPISDRLAEQAVHNRIWIGCGLTEKEDGHLYNTAVLLNPDGEIVLKHRKINLLSQLMDPPYTAGSPEDIRVAETPYGRAGMLICADSFEPKLLSLLKAQKPDWVYIPFGWAHPAQGWPEHGFKLLQVVQRAARHIGAPVLGPNLVGKVLHGPWKGQTFEGLSTAADRTGLSLVQGPWKREEVLFLELELSTAKV